METYLNLTGVECIAWIDEQGSHSMLKSAYEEQQTALSTPIVSGDGD